MFEKFKKSLELVESKYFGLDLLTEQYPIEELVEEAKKKGYGAHLGYLCEVFYKGTDKNVLNRERLLKIYKLLEGNYPTWQYLHPNLPNFGKEIVRESKKNELNKKWKIYSNLIPFEVKDLINLYAKCQYLKKKSS